MMVVMIVAAMSNTYVAKEWVPCADSGDCFCPTGGPRSDLRYSKKLWDAWHEEHELQRMRAEAPPDLKDSVTVFLGDSITQGWQFGMVKWETKIT